MDCPSSFKCFNGKVWYYLQAIVDIPWAKDYEDKIDLTVQAPIDLNTLSNINLVRIDKDMRIKKKQKKSCSVFSLQCSTKMKKYFVVAGVPANRFL